MTLSNKIKTALYIMLLSIPFINKTVLAENVPIILIKIEGNYALSNERILEGFALAKAKHLAAGNNLKLVKFIQIPEISTSIHDIDLYSMIQRLRDYERFARQNHLSSGRKKVIFVTPPVEYASRRWIMGISRICTPGKPVSFVAAQEKNTDNVNRFFHYPLSIEHELAHTLGAYHYDALPPTIMHSDALFYLSDATELPWAEKSIKQMAKCKFQ